MRNNSHRLQILTLDNIEDSASGVAGSYNRRLSGRRRMAPSGSDNQDSGNWIPAICYYTERGAFLMFYNMFLLY